VTAFSVPPATVTPMPFAGSVPAALPPGVIVTAGPAGVGFALADAEAPAALPVAPPLAAALVPPVFATEVAVLAVHAVTAATSAAPVTRTEPSRITLMCTSVPDKRPF
jgi:hypothetical protein